MTTTITPNFTKEPGYAYFQLYDKFTIKLPIEDWVFMCNKRWFSDTPKTEDVEAEFGICGAREAKNDEEANTIVQKTVNAYKRIMYADVEADCRELLHSTSKTIGRMDQNGHIYFEEAEE